MDEGSGRRARRSAAVVGFEGTIFVHHCLTDSDGLGRTYAITEATSDPAGLGDALLAVLNEPWPDIYPSWPELIKSVLRRTGVSSERRFVARSNYADVEADGRTFTVTAWKPDGIGGYSGVPGAPEYELADPDNAALGSAVLRALDDSAAFAGRPRVR